MMIYTLQGEKKNQSLYMIEQKIVSLNTEGWHITISYSKVIKQ